MSPPQSMTALSGVPYGPNSGSIRPDVNMTDISSYQPWKALNEFAMHNDMDQGAFQQLVRWPIFSLTMVIALPCLGLKWCCALILGYSFHLVLSDHYLSSYPSLTFPRTMAWSILTQKWLFWYIFVHDVHESYNPFKDEISQIKSNIQYLSKTSVKFCSHNLDLLPSPLIFLFLDIFFLAGHLFSFSFKQIFSTKIKIVINFL